MSIQDITRRAAALARMGNQRDASFHHYARLLNAATGVELEATEQALRLRRGEDRTWLLEIKTSAGQIGNEARQRLMGRTRITLDT